jgi:hypothetical protein
VGRIHNASRRRYYADVRTDRNAKQTVNATSESEWQCDR